MIEAIIDGREIQDRRQLHEALAAQLHFPEWYGKNLDALYDCLTDVHEETVIRLLNLEELEGKTFPEGFKTTFFTFIQCMEVALEGTGLEAKINIEARKRI